MGKSTGPEDAQRIPGMDALVRWVALVIERSVSLYEARPRWLDSLRGTLSWPTIDARDEQWRDLIEHEKLNSWLRDVATDPAVRSIYGYEGDGGSDARADRTLRDAALKFGTQQSISARSFDESSVRSAAIDFWRAVTASEETWELGGILYHATFPQDAPDEILLGEHVDGERKTRFILHRLTANWVSPRYLSPEGNISTLAAVVAVVTRRRNPYTSEPSRFDRSNRVDNILRQATLPIRLATDHSGFVMNDYLYYYPPTLRRGWKADTDTLHRLMDYTQDGVDAWPTLSAEEVEEITRTGELFVNPKPALDYMNQASTEPLVLALGRFHGQTLPRNPQDQVIDLAVALETMFSDGNTEITQKVRMRSAILVGKSTEHSRRIYRFVADFYNIRSRLVHGSSRRPSRKNPSIDDEVKSALKRWDGTLNPSDTPRGRMGQLVRIMSDIVRDGLRAYVWLSAEGRLDPAGDTFQATLDCLAFSPDDRESLQKAGHLR